MCWRTYASKLFVERYYRSRLLHVMSARLGARTRTGCCPTSDDPLTYVQCVGLRGLQYAVDGAELITDVVNLVDVARQKLGDMETLPSLFANCTNDGILHDSQTTTHKKEHVQPSTHHSGSANKLRYRRCASCTRYGLVQLPADHARVLPMGTTDSACSALGKG